MERIRFVCPLHHGRYADTAILPSNISRIPPSSSPPPMYPRFIQDRVREALADKRVVLISGI